jgi:hypothetical protein
MTPLQLYKKFEQLENDNFHGEASLLLANYFKNKDAIFLLTKINEMHLYIGHLPAKLSAFRCEVSEPLYKLYNELMIAEGIEKPSDFVTVNDLPF